MERLADKPFTLLGINSDKDREALKTTLVDERINWRSWWDNGSVSGPIHTQMQVTLRPAIHLLDANGIIRYKLIDAGEVDKAIDGLLEELAANSKQ